MKEVNVVLGAKVNALRKSANITRERLAEMIDVSPRFLADVEGGKVGVSLETLKKLCAALSTSADDLLGIAEAEDRLQKQVMSKLAAVDIKYYRLILVILNELANLD